MLHYVKVFRKLFQKNDVFCLQTQLAQLQEKCGQEALRAEQWQTLSNDSKIKLDNLKSQNSAQAETISKLQEENKRLTKILNESKTTALVDKKIMSDSGYIAALGFLFSLPAKGKEATRNSENIKISSEVSGNVTVLLNHEENNYPISLTFETKIMVSCHFSITITILGKKQATPILTCET